MHQKDLVLVPRCGNPETSTSWASVHMDDELKVESHGKDLAGKNVTGANLTGANLTGANLDEADLTGANLTGVVGANLTGVILE